MKIVYHDLFNKDSCINDRKYIEHVIWSKTLLDLIELQNIKITLYSLIYDLETSSV